jgi:hypothetical protein
MRIAVSALQAGSAVGINRFAKVVGRWANGAADCAVQVQLYPLEFTIMRYGELGLEMFILAHGSAAVLAESGSLIAELHPVQPCNSVLIASHPDATYAQYFSPTHLRP